MWWSAKAANAAMMIPVERNSRSEREKLGKADNKLKIFDRKRRERGNVSQKSTWRAEPALGDNNIYLRNASRGFSRGQAGGRVAGVGVQSTRVGR